MIELQHAGDQNDQSLATWEHWYDDSSSGGNPNGTQGSFIIRESDDNFKSWNTLSTVYDLQTGPGHPCVRFWQPFFFDFPHQIANYPEGTLLLVGHLVPQSGSFTQLFSWRSMDHGKTWNAIGEWQLGAPRRYQAFGSHFSAWTTRAGSLPPFRMSDILRIIAKCSYTLYPRTAGTPG